MDNQLDISKHPYGLDGGYLLNGNVQVAVEGYCYYPLSNSGATLRFSNIENGTAVNSTFTAGIPVFGHITAVTQSSGLAIVYYGAPDQPRYR
jgi:hypothetical protein